MVGLAARRESAYWGMVSVELSGNDGWWGVPGTLKSTTFLPAHSLLASYSWGMPQAVASVSVMGAHLQARSATCPSQHSTVQQGAYSNLTPSGKLSPTLRGAIAFAGRWEEVEKRCTGGRNSVWRETMGSWVGGRFMKTAAGGVGARTLEGHMEGQKRQKAPQAMASPTPLPMRP